jgi:branched-chain amino acid transport system substrate-binding protein
MISPQLASRISRRGALATLTLGLAGLYVAACAPAPATPATTASPTIPTQSAPTAQSGSAKLVGPELRIGALITSTGPVAEVGRKNLLTLKLFESEINAAGGVGGVPLKIVSYDTGQKPDQAASMFRKLAQDDQVLAVVGPLSSGECEVVFPIANQLKLVAISYASSKPGVSAANRPYAFRNTMDESKLAKLSVPRFLATYNVSKPAIICDSADAVSTSLGKGVLPAQLKAAGAPPINAANPLTFQSSDTDLAAQVTKLKSLGADSLALGAEFGPASNVLRELNRQGVILPVLGGSPLLSNTTLLAAGKVPVLAPATFFVGEKRPSAEAFVKKFAVNASDLPENSRDPLQFDANAYDIGTILVRAILEGGVTNQPSDLAPDRERIMRYATALKPFDGVGGKSAFDTSGDGDKDVYVVVARDGQWVELG